MSDHPQEKLVSLPELVASARRLAGEDPQAFWRLVDEIRRDEAASSAVQEMCKETDRLSAELGYPAWQLLEAVVSIGLAETLGFLRREAERRATAATLARVM